MFSYSSDQTYSGMKKQLYVGGFSQERDVAFQTNPQSHRQKNSEPYANIGSTDCYNLIEPASSAQ